MKSIFKKIINEISKERWIYILFIISFVITLYFRNIHDYLAYVNEWKKIFNGENPFNAYGVFFNFFALPNAIHHKLPKIIFIFIYFFTISKLFKLYEENNLIRIALLFNPIFWVFGVLLGSNDVFLASITLLSLITLMSQKNVVSGILLSIGITFKYTPLSILPFLILKNKSLNIKLIISTLSTIVVVILLGFCFWGDELFSSFMFNVNRKSTIFSIFRFISGEYHPLQFVNISSLDYLSIYFVIISWVILYILFIIYKFEKYLAILLAYSNMLLFYKVGHHQFYLLLFLLTVLTYSIHKKSFQKNKILIISIVLFWTWIFLFTLLYPLTDLYRGDFYHIREWVGLPTFIIHVFLNIQLFLMMLKMKVKPTNSVKLK